MKNGGGSASFAPSNIGSGTHSRQRSPVMGALGKEAKLGNATQMININDKKLETMGSFNLTMNAVPITTNPAEEVKTHMQHVKEE